MGHSSIAMISGKIIWKFSRFDDADDADGNNVNEVQEEEEVKAYVNGFLFDGDKVLLIEKKRPDWQAGKLNGIGGKIESGETPDQAMRREFMEETGIVIPLPEWRYRGRLYCERWTVYFFVAFWSAKNATAMTDEVPVLVDPKKLPSHAIPNLRWLIPLCADLHIPSFDLLDMGAKP